VHFKTIIHKEEFYLTPFEEGGTKSFITIKPYVYNNGAYEYQHNIAAIIPTIQRRKGAREENLWVV